MAHGPVHFSTLVFIFQNYLLYIKILYGLLDAGIRHSISNLSLDTWRHRHALCMQLHSAGYFS